MSTTIQQDVKSAVRIIFVNEKSEIRKLKHVKSCILEHANDPSIAQLLSKHGEHAVCTTAHELLMQNAFATKTAQKVVSPESDAVEVGASPVANVAVKADQAPDMPDFPINARVDPEPANVEQAYNRAPAPQTSMTQEHVLPQAHTLPFPAQHLLLCQTQKILEQACFRYAQQHMPDVLEQRRCFCAEAVELNTWVQMLQRHHHRFKMPVSASISSSPVLFRSLAQLRHVTVHRAPLELGALKQFMLEAQMFVLEIDDHEALQLLNGMYRGTLVAIRHIERIQVQTQARLTEIREELWHKQAVLLQTATRQAEDLYLGNEIEQQGIGESLERAIERSVRANEAMVAPDEKESVPKKPLAASRFVWPTIGQARWTWYLRVTGLYWLSLWT